MKKPNLGRDVTLPTFHFREVLKKIAVSQFQAHLSENELIEVFQSLLCVAHSTEITVTEVANGLLMAPHPTFCSCLT